MSDLDGFTKCSSDGKSFGYWRQGIKVSAEWMIPKALWIKENEPDLFEKAATICEFQDYMNLHLTGRKCASINNVSARWHYDRSQGGIPETMLEKLGLGDLSENGPGMFWILGKPLEA